MNAEDSPEGYSRRVKSYHVLRGRRKRFPVSSSGMNKVLIYTAVPCGYCTAAKGFFEKQGIPYEEVDLTGDRDARMGLIERTGQRTVPQIFVGETHVGGYTDLVALASAGELQALLG